MATYSVAEARNNLSRLIERAKRGETVEITRHGKVAARLMGPDEKPKEEWREALRRVLLNPVEPLQGPIDAVALIREMRDEGY